MGGRGEGEGGRVGRRKSVRKGERWKQFWVGKLGNTEQKLTENPDTQASKTILEEKQNYLPKNISRNLYYSLWKEPVLQSLKLLLGSY